MTNPKQRRKLSYISTYNNIHRSKEDTVRTWKYGHKNLQNKRRKQQE